MAIVDCESFMASTAIADFINGGLIIQPGNALSILGGQTFGDNALVLSAGLSASARRMWPGTPLTAFTVGWRGQINSGAANNYNPGLTITDSVGTAQCAVGFNTSLNTIALNRGASNSSLFLVGPTTFSFPLTTYAYWELQVLAISATVGKMELRRNGVVLLTGTGLNNKGSASTANGASCLWTTNTGGSGGHQVQHYYLTDTTGSSPYNGYLGDVRVGRVGMFAPNATQFSPVGGTNLSNANAYPPSSGAYNGDNVAGHEDSFAVNALPTNMTQLLAIALKSFAANADPGSRTFANKIISGGITANGATNTLSSSAFTYVRDIVQNDPNTGVPWTPAGFNAAIAGYRIVS